MSKKATGYYLIFSCLVLGSALVGCDQLKEMFQTKPLSSAPKAVTPNESQAPAVQGTVLAKINNEVITLESFDEKVKNLQALSPELKLDTAEAKKSYLNDLVTQELVYQEAKSRGIDKKQDVKDAVEEFRKGIMARQLLMDETKGLTVEPAEIEAFYAQNKSLLAPPPDIRAREICVSTEAAAKEIMVTLYQGNDFAAIATEKSIDASASKGGDLGVVKPEDYKDFPKFLEVVGTLEAGQFSQIFSGPKGYYIVKVEEKKGGVPPQLTDKLPDTNMTIYDSIKDLLLQQKQAQRVQELADRLKRDAKIELKEDLLN
jgi:peptidyl-prolyl cis-trans isomerase C